MWFPLVALLIGMLCLVMAGCTSPARPAAGDPDRGHDLFLSHCRICHTLPSGPDPTGPAIGPNLEHIATTGATRKPGLSATAYIRESITDHNAFIAPESTQKTGPMGLYDPLSKLSNQEVADLVAFLLTQQ